MTESNPLRKRRHLLSSIDQDEADTTAQPTTSSDDRHAAREPCTGAENQSRITLDEDGGEETNRPRRSRLRLKSDKSRRRRSRSRQRNNGRHDGDERLESHNGDGNRHSPRPGRHHRRHRHNRHRHRSPTLPNPFEPAPLDPEAAFRESLFDAMADDEGASYWESVYGQPIHVYANEKSGPTGTLEQMTDEEYAAYVRQKMWEKTHAGLLEDRARREEQRRQRKEEERKARKLHEEMERSLRRGEERRQRRRWAEQWKRYTDAWASWDGTLDTLAWPVDGGREDLDDEHVRSFLVRGLGREDMEEQAFANRLREERIRWHPDKIQQRLRGAADDEVMKDVTAVFQTIDKLWAEVRPKA